MFFEWAFVGSGAPLTLQRIQPSFCNQANGVLLRNLPFVGRKSALSQKGLHITMLFGFTLLCSTIYCAIVMCPCIDCTEWNEWYLCLWRLSSVHQIAQSSSMWNIGGQSLCLLYQCCIIFVVLTLYDLLHAPCEHLELLGKVICLQQDSEEGNLQERKCFLTSGIYWSPLKT